jgi:hypothetical protein
MAFGEQLDTYRRQRLGLLGLCIEVSPSIPYRHSCIVGQPWAIWSFSSDRLAFGTRFSEVSADRRYRYEQNGS